MSDLSGKSNFHYLFAGPGSIDPRLEARIESHFDGSRKVARTLTWLFFPLMIVVALVSRNGEISKLLVGVTVINALVNIAALWQSAAWYQWISRSFLLIFGAVFAHYMHVAFSNHSADLSAYLYDGNSVPSVLLPLRDLSKIIGSYDRLLSLNFFMASIFAFVIFYPVRCRRMAPALFLFSCMGFYACWNLLVSIWIYAYFLTLAGGFFVKAVIEARVIKSILTQLEHEDSIRKMTESIFFRDLELAREIQLSLDVPRTISTDAFEIDFYLRAHQMVGGDWVAVRGDGEDGYWILVVDAVGKGMQAALVVHAIQSLWTSSLDQNLDPASWIGLVNKTLVRMGQKAAHSATLGLLHLNGERLTYWSAGHCPLLLNGRRGGEEFVRKVIAPGDFVGVGDEVQLNPRTLELAGGGIQQIVLCSDGLLDILPRGRKMLAVMRSIDEDLHGTAQRLEVDDDLTLVRIRLKSWSESFALDQAV